MARRHETVCRLHCDALRRELASLGGEAAALARTLPAYDAGRPCPPGCDCLGMLVEPAVRDRELADGALFVIEDWARQWPRWANATFGGGEAVLRELLGRDHRCLVCLRTPGSGDYSGAAAEAGRRAGLPVRWLDVDLERLAESVAPAIGDGEAP